MKEKIIGLYKSILMRLQLSLSPILSWLRNAISVFNALLSVIIIVLLVYALGFPVKFDEVIPLTLFKLAFLFFFCENTYLAIDQNHLKRGNNWAKTSALLSVFFRTRKPMHFLDNDYTTYCQISQYFFNKKMIFFIFYI